MANDFLIRTITVIDTTIDEEASVIPYEKGNETYQYRDYKVPIGRTGYEPLAVAGMKISNATENGKNASLAKVSWAYIGAKDVPKLLYVRVRTESKKKSVIKCEAQVLYAKV